MTGQCLSKHTFSTTAVESLGLFIMFSGCMRPVVDAPQFSWHDNLNGLVSRSAERQHRLFFLLWYMDCLEPLWTDSHGGNFRALRRNMPLCLRGHTEPGRCFSGSEGWRSLQVLNFYPYAAGGRTPYLGMNVEPIPLKIETTGAMQAAGDANYFASSGGVPARAWGMSCSIE